MAGILATTAVSAFVGAPPPPALLVLCQSESPYRGADALDGGHGESLALVGQMSRDGIEAVGFLLIHYASACKCLDTCTGRLPGRYQ